MPRTQLPTCSSGRRVVLLLLLFNMSQHASLASCALPSLESRTHVALMHTSYSSQRPRSPQIARSVDSQDKPFRPDKHPKPQTHEASHQITPIKPRPSKLKNPPSYAVPRLRCGQPSTKRASTVSSHAKSQASRDAALQHEIAEAVE